MNEHEDLNLKQVVSTPDFPGDEIRKRVRATLAEAESPDGEAEIVPIGRRPGGWGRVVVGIAASLLLFVVGLEYGRHIERSTAAGTTVAAAPASIPLPLAIQQEGTEYVRVLTQAGQVIDGLSPEERDEVRAAAYAVLYGAAAELLRSALDEEVAGPLYQILQTQRRRERGVQGTEEIWF